MTLRNEKLTEQLQELQAAFEQQAQHSQLQQQLQPVTAQSATARSSSSSATTTDDQQSSTAARLRELEERLAATTRDMARVQAAHRHEVRLLCCCAQTLLAQYRAKLHSMFAVQLHDHVVWGHCLYQNVAEHSIALVLHAFCSYNTALH
jgi:protein required for attachment to host cells